MWACTYLHHITPYVHKQITEIDREPDVSLGVSREFVLYSLDRSLKICSGMYALQNTQIIIHVTNETVLLVCVVLRISHDWAIVSLNSLTRDTYQDTIQNKRGVRKREPESERCLQ